MTTETDRIEADINRSRTALNDTIEQLGGKLSPGQILDEALGLAKGQAGKFTANLGRQVRDNPIPLLLIGAGIGMLFMNRNKGDGADTSWGVSHDEWYADQTYRNLESVRAGVERGAGETDEEWAHRRHEAEAGALNLKQRAGEALDAFKQRVKATGDGIAKTAAGVRDRMSAGMSQAAHFMGDQAHNVKAGMGQAAHFMGDQAHNVKAGLADAKHRTQAFYDEYPLAAGAIGVAIGAIIGASAPLSSFERDKLQGVADTAARAGADLAEKGARAVENTADKAAAALH